MAAGRHLRFWPEGHSIRSGMGHFWTRQPQKHESNLVWMRNYFVHWGV